MIIQPVSWERPYRDQYEAVRHELEEQGFAVRIVEPAPFEERGADVVHNIALLMATPEVVIHLAEQLADHALDILEAVLIAYLIGRVKVGPKQGTPRRAQILGPDGRLPRNSSRMRATCSWRSRQSAGSRAVIIASIRHAASAW